MQVNAYSALGGGGGVGVSEDIGGIKRHGALAHKAGLTLTALFQAVHVLAGWPPNRGDWNPIEMA
jgi:hypothetical protein